MQITSECGLTFSNRWPFAFLPCPYSQLHYQQRPALVPTLLSDNPNIFLRPLSARLNTIAHSPCSMQGRTLPRVLNFVFFSQAGNGSHCLQGCLI